MAGKSRSRKRRARSARRKSGGNRPSAPARKKTTSVPGEEETAVTSGPKAASPPGEVPSSATEASSPAPENPSPSPAPEEGPPESSPEEGPPESSATECPPTTPTEKPRLPRSQPAASASPKEETEDESVSLRSLMAKSRRNPAATRPAPSPAAEVAPRRERLPRPARPRSAAGGPAVPAPTAEAGEHPAPRERLPRPSRSPLTPAEPLSPKKGAPENPSPPPRERLPRPSKSPVKTPIDAKSPGGKASSTEDSSSAGGPEDPVAEALHSRRVSASLLSKGAAPDVRELRKATRERRRHPSTKAHTAPRRSTPGPFARFFGNSPLIGRWFRR